MHVNWYPFYEGDYLRDTYHLSWDEDLAYRRLLDLCYRNNGRLTINRKLLYRQLRVDENDPVKCAAVESVLKQFFKARGKSYQNQRVSKEVLKADLIHQARVKGGKEKGKHSAQAQLSSSSALLSTATTTTTATATEESPNSSLSQVQRLGVSLSLWTQYKNLRESFARPIFAGTEKLIFDQLAKWQAAGEDPTEILTRAVSTSSWKLCPNGAKGEKPDERKARQEAQVNRALRKARHKLATETGHKLPH